MSLFELYLITTIVPNIGTVLGFILAGCIGGMIAGTIGRIAAADNRENDKITKWDKLIKQSVIWAIIVLLASIPIPDSKQLYTMAGGYVATNTKDIDKLPANVVSAANAWLEKAAKEAKK